MNKSEKTLISEYNLKCLIYINILNQGDNACILILFCMCLMWFLYNIKVSLRPQPDLKLSDYWCSIMKGLALVKCIMMWKMSGMKLYLALSRWECVCAYGRIIAWQFQCCHQIFTSHISSIVYWKGCIPFTWQCWIGLDIM